MSFEIKKFRNKIGSGKRHSDYMITVHSKREFIIDKYAQVFNFTCKRNYVIAKFSVIRLAYG
jgi:hypothetical protein